MADEPITQKISTDLRRQIHEGILGPGALLPSEPEVAREYGVSRQTARTALQALEREGLVIVRPRRGRVVRSSSQRLRWHLSEFERPDHTVLATSDAWETDIERQGHDPTRPGPPRRADHPARNRRGTSVIRGVPGEFSCRDVEGERSAVADRALGPGAAAMEVHDLTDGGESYADAGELLRGVEALKRDE
jgi:DNA-binding transcriptional regulator YhcF (GntR family)